MNTFLIKLCVKDYQNTDDPAVRERYGKFAGIVGILSNLILCTMKIVIGLISSSIAIVADGINNLAEVIHLDPIIDQCEFHLLLIATVGRP